MYLLFDIGATKTRIAVSPDGSELNSPEILSTPPRFIDGIKNFVAIAQKLTQGGKIRAAAGGIPGPLNKERSVVINAPNLPDWNNKPLKKQLEEGLAAPVFIENDTAMVGLGEAVVGPGMGHSIVVYMTISTGVGGVRLVDGRIDRNSLGFEPGHQYIDADKSLCPPCPGLGTLEDYISGRSFEQRFGKKPYEITDEKIWDETARWLAFGLNNTVVHWSPDIVILGGSMMKKIGIPIERVRYYLKQTLKIFPIPNHPRVEKASLGDVGGLYGSLSYLKQHLRTL